MKLTLTKRRTIVSYLSGIAFREALASADTLKKVLNLLAPVNKVVENQAQLEEVVRKGIALSTNMSELGSIRSYLHMYYRENFFAVGALDKEILVETLNRATEHSHLRGICVAYYESEVEILKDRDLWKLIFEKADKLFMPINTRESP